MDNTFNYSDDWKPYEGYDKFEYDIKTKDGNIFTNMYPNAGKFQSLKEGNDVILEEDVSEIRFSNNPYTYLNYNVSNIKPEINDIEDITDIGNTNSNEYPAFKNYFESLKNDIPLNNGVFYERPVQYIRQNPKMKRNDLCSCGSGKNIKNVVYEFSSIFFRI